MNAINKLLNNKNISNKIYYKTENMILINGACLDVLKYFPDESIDCVVTSPPYNKGYFRKTKISKSSTWKYGDIKYDSFEDNLEWEEYKKQQIKVLQELLRIIKKNGSVFYNHKPQLNNHKIYFPDWIFNFNLRQIIIWDRGSSPALSPIRWYPTTEYIFWITKTNIQPKFKRRGEFDKEVWKIIPKPYLEHPAPFPEKLVYECIINTTDENDVVLDCYSGSGTTGLVCAKYKRKFVGIDISKNYCELAKKRIENENKQLKLF